MEERVWEKYLTERDKALSAQQPLTRRGLGKSPVLLLVDLYRNAFGPQRAPLLEAIKVAPSSCGEEAWDALVPIQRLLKAARAAQVQVVHVTGLSELPSWRAERMTEGHAASQKLRAEQYEIMEQVGPIEGEIVLRKAAPSAFWGTPLAAHLNQLGADSIIVAGESTSGCVRATVVDACSHRLKVTVVEDCVFDRTEAAHAINLFDMAQKYADVVSVDQVSNDLGQLQPHYR